MKTSTAARLFMLHFLCRLRLSGTSAGLIYGQTQQEPGCLPVQMKLKLFPSQKVNAGESRATFILCSVSEKKS